MTSILEKTTGLVAFVRTVDAGSSQIGVCNVAKVSGHEGS
jgi:hypothetical protein